MTKNKDKGSVKLMVNKIGLNINSLVKIIGRVDDLTNDEKEKIFVYLEGVLSDAKNRSLSNLDVTSGFSFDKEYKNKTPIVMCKEVVLGDSGVIARPSGVNVVVSQDGSVEGKLVGGARQLPSIVDDFDFVED